MGRSLDFEDRIIEAVRAQLPDAILLREPLRRECDAWALRPRVEGKKRPRYPDLVVLDPAKIVRGLRRRGDGWEELNREQTVARILKLQSRAKGGRKQIGLGAGLDTRRKGKLVVVLAEPRVDAVWEMKHCFKGPPRPRPGWWAKNRRQFDTYVHDFAPRQAWCVVPVHPTDGLARVPRDLRERVVDGPVPGTKMFSLVGV